MEPQKTGHNKMKLMITVVDRGKGRRVIELCRREHSTFHLSFMGRGTADSALLDYLGLGETEKDIVMSVVMEERLEQVMEALDRAFSFHEPGNGIAFTIPIRSVGGWTTLRYLSGPAAGIDEEPEERSRNFG